MENFLETIQESDPRELLTQLAAAVNDYSGLLLLLVLLLSVLALVSVGTITRRNKKHLEQGVRYISKQVATANSDLSDKVNEQVTDLSRAAAGIRESSRAAAGEQAKMVKSLDERTEKQGVYAHDQFAALAQAVDNIAKSNAQNQKVLLERVEKLLSENAAGGGDAAREQNKLMQETMKMVNDSVNNMTKAVDAKMELLAEKIGGQVKERIGDLPGAIEQSMNDSVTRTMNSFKELETRLAEVLTSNAEFSSLGHEISSLSKVLQAKEERFGHKDLTELLMSAMADDRYQLNVAVNGRVASALLFMPGQAGDVAVDATFNVSEYIQKIVSDESDADAHRQARQELTEALQKHITENTTRLIDPPQTGDSVLLFISSETAFAEIQAHHRDVLHQASTLRVWLVSPATLMTIFSMMHVMFQGYRASQQMEIMRTTLTEVLEEARAFENRLAEIHDFVGNASRSAQRAENAGAKLVGRVSNILDEAARVKWDDDGNGK